MFAVFVGEKKYRPVGSDGLYCDIRRYGRGAWLSLAHRSGQAILFPPWGTLSA
jgi:hypothetical protein